MAKETMNGAYSMKEMFTMLSDKFDRLEKKFDSVIDAIKCDTRNEINRVEDNNEEEHRTIWKTISNIEQNKLGTKAFYWTMGIFITLGITFITLIIQLISEVK
jgi:hypothetical protein